MSDYNPRAELRRVEMTPTRPGKKIGAPRVVHSGTVADCVNRVMAKREPDRLIYSMSVPLEAGFGKIDHNYRDIEAISRRPDLPRSAR
jgi:hypothetical protein